RWQSPMRKLKAVIDSGAIGEPTRARIAFRTGYDIYAVQPYLHQAKRYAILDVGIHMLDLARFFLGDVERVSCETQTRNPENIGEDTATIMMRHRSGAVSVVECSMESRIDPDPFPETLVTIEGERGSAFIGPGLAGRVASGGQSRDGFRLPIAALDLAALAYRPGERAQNAGGDRSRLARGQGPGIDRRRQSEDLRAGRGRLRSGALGPLGRSARHLNGPWRESVETISSCSGGRAGPASARPGEGRHLRLGASQTSAVQPQRSRAPSLTPLRL